MKNKVKISKASTIIILIALLRTMAEPFRLQYYAEASLNFEQLRPFLLAGLIISAGLLAMTVLYYYGRHILVVLIGISVIIAMLVIKYLYL